MPQVLRYGRYLLFFWSGKDGEPVHVHVSEGKPNKHATIFWLTSNGGCILAHNGSNIPSKDLRDLTKIISLNHTFICDRWAEVFEESRITFIS